MSWGTSPWGSSPWGGTPASLTPNPSVFDLYCFVDDTMPHILADPDVSTVSVGSQVLIDLSSEDLLVQSGGSEPASDARVYVDSLVPAQWTLEYTVFLSDLPQDFTDLVGEHVFVGVTDASGPCAGLFFSKQGLAYVGAIHHTGGGDLVLDSSLYLIPGSEDYIEGGEYLTVRLVSDSVTESVYLFVTPTATLGLTGHVLRAILPAIPASALAFPPTDRTTISVRGTVTDASVVYFEQLCLASSIVMPNLAPVANAGVDQAAYLCSIIQLDGSASFDPEGAPLTYEWRLVDAPPLSIYTFQGKDGETAAGSGFTNKFYSATELAAEEAINPVLPGDVLNIAGVAHTVSAKGTDGGGFFVQVASSTIPEGLSQAGFKLLRQNGISGATTANPTFFPDIPGFYKFDLLVTDGVLPSDPSGIDRAPVVINVIESPLPRGCTPDLKFIFNYLSDFWRLVEGRDVISAFWAALAQVAATELYTLWQHEYSRSLRDVQRTFIRRWLHYDLLLAEPIPELTKLRVVRSGVTSTAVPDAGDAGLVDTFVQLESPAFEQPESFQIFGPGPVTPEYAATQLRNRLAEIDERFTVTLIDDRASTDKYIRIDAPFPFEITEASSSPSSLFVVGDSNGMLSGSLGAAVGPHMYKVERSLLDAGLKENDLLIIDGEGYRVAQIVDNASDDLPYQRIVVKEDLPLVVGTSWKLSGYVTSELLDFYNGLVREGDIVYFEVTDARPEFAPAAATHALVQTTALGTNSTKVSALAFDSAPLDLYLARAEENTIRLAKVVRRSNVPVADLVTDIPTLQDVIVVEDEQTILRRNLDFFLVDFRGRLSIEFESGRTGGPDVWEGEEPPARLWAEYTYLDNRPTIEANFGIPVEFTLDHLSQLDVDLDYLSAVRGLWYAYYHGPTIYNLRVGTQILLGLPFAEKEGKIEEIRTDFSSTQGRILIRDTANEEIVRSYTYPRVLELEINPETGQKYKAGDIARRFAPLVSGAEVIDYVKDPTWFEGLLHQGVFYEVEKFHKFLVRVDSAAFSLSTLLFVRNFVMKIKPTYTTPLLVVKYEVSAGATEISIADTVTASGRLNLVETPCEGFLGAATQYDDPRAAGGGWRNQFDEDADPGTPDPTIPTPDAEVLWAWDKNYLCPEDSVSVDLYTMSNGAISTDSVFAYGSSLEGYVFFYDTSVVSVPAVGGYEPTLDFARNANDAFGNTATLASVLLLIWGSPGLDPTDYQLVVVVDGVDQVTLPFTVGEFGTEQLFNLDPYSISAPAGDPVGVRIEVASGGSDRSPSWHLVRARLVQRNALTWSNGATPSQGTYGEERLLS